MSKNIKIQGTDYNIKSTSGDVEFKLFGNAVVDGNLTVDGTTTTVNSETLTIADNLITLNSNVTASPIEDAGIEIERGTAPNVKIQWNETSDQWESTSDGTNYFKILTTANTGSGSGLDADTLDNYDSAEFAVRAEAELITGRYTFNESGTDVYNTSPNNDTIVNIDGTTTTNLSYKLGGFTRIDNNLSSTDFSLSRYDGAGALLDTPLNINLADGTIDLVSATLLQIDTPLIKGADGQDLIIDSGTATVLNADGQNLILRGGLGNGTGSRGSIVLGDPLSPQSVLDSPSQLIVSTQSGTISLNPQTNVVMSGINYPTTDGNIRDVLTTDGANNFTMAPLNFTTLLTNPDSLSTANFIIKMNAAATAWEYVVDFRNVVEDTAPKLGGDLNTKNFEITSELGQDIKINPNGIGSVVFGGTGEGSINVKSPIGVEMQVVSGANTGATDGENLIIGGGSSDTGNDGVVILGQASASEAILQAQTATDMHLKVDAGNNVIFGSTSAVTGALIGPQGGDLTVSGGEGIAVAEDGGDLILRGGISALANDGVIIFDSPVVFTSPIPTIGAVYPLNFFIPDLLTTGLNPNIVLDSFGVTENSTIQTTGHVGYATTTSTLNTTYILKKISGGTATTIGSVTFNSGTNSASIISITDTGLIAGDVVQVLNPATPDITIADVTITLRTITA